MEVTNCRGCGRLFNYLQGPKLCPACVDELEKKFVEVKEYIRANPSATITQISEENEVTTKQIKQWIREERLSFTDDSPIGIECENCGTMIKTGRFCNNCKNVLQHDLAQSIEKPRTLPDPSTQKSKNRDKSSMRFL